jgi:hypothetical protein
MGYVYFIRDGGKITKVGRTKLKPEKRLRQLQTGNPRKLELIAWIEVADDVVVERDLHKKWADRRSPHGGSEWFKISRADIHTALRDVRVINMWPAPASRCEIL